MNQVGTAETMGKNNRKLILDFVRKNSPVSRADIKRSLGMSFPAVSSNIKALIDANYLYETGIGDNAIGRKSTLVSFNSTRGYIIGIDIGRYKIRTALANVSGDIVETMTIEMNSKKVSNDIIHQIQLQIDILLKSHKIEKNNILCISIGIPGIVDKSTGNIRLAPFMEQLNEKEIIENLISYCDCPILIDSSMNYGAIGEKWKGVGSGYKDIVYLNYSVGIGCALVLNGELYRGKNGVAGEIGYMVLDRKRLRTTYKEEGVLESMIAGNHLNTILAEKCYAGGIEKLIENYDSDPYSKKLLDEISDYVGILLINICSVSNPELIILGGGLGKNLGEIFIDKWTKMLVSHIPFVPQLVCSNLENKANVLGAIAVALRYINEEIEIV